MDGEEIKVASLNFQEAIALLSAAQTILEEDEDEEPEDNFIINLRTAHEKLLVLCNLPEITA